MSNPLTAMSNNDVVLHAHRVPRRSRHNIRSSFTFRTRSFANSGLLGLPTRVGRETKHRSFLLRTGMEGFRRRLISSTGRTARSRLTFPRAGGHLDSGFKYRGRLGVGL
jgi:hypothetical protein